MKNSWLPTTRCLLLIGCLSLFGCFGGGLNCNGSVRDDEAMSLSASLHPQRLTLRAGEEGEVVVTITETDAGTPVDGMHRFSIADTPQLDITPNEFSLEFTGVTQATQTLTVRAKDAAQPGGYTSGLYWDRTYLRKQVEATVVGETANDINIFADKNTVIVEDYEGSEEVTFSVYSTTYTGPVSITLAASGGNYNEQPAGVPSTVTLPGPNQTVTFKKTLQKVTGDPVTLTYTAKILPDGPSKSTSILIRNP
jgi:hypothetical protein